jgi:plasmid stabilization system protein ParE
VSAGATATPAPDTGALARSVAAAVAAHPDVARLDGGAFGDIATHVPGDRLVGVRIGRADEPVEIAVVLHLLRPVPDAVRSLRREVAAVCGAAGHPVTSVDVVVADLADPDGDPDTGHDSTPGSTTP